MAAVGGWNRGREKVRIGNGNGMGMGWAYAHGTVDAYIQRCTLSLSTYKPSSRAQIHADAADVECAF